MYIFYLIVSKDLVFTVFSEIVGCVKSLYNYKF